MKNKRLILTLLLLTFILILYACATPTDTPGNVDVGSGSESTPQPQPQPQPGSEPVILTIAITTDENTLTPITYVRGSPGFDMLRFMYDSLFTISAENEVIPWMVGDDFTISDDFRVYEMTMLAGQKWHDGTDVTPQDVVFTFDFFKNTHTHSRWSPIANRVESIDIDGDNIKLTLYNPDFGFLRSGLADMRIMSETAYGGADDAELVPNMGSGPFRLLEYVTGQFYTLEAMAGYFRGTPTVQTIRMPIITDRAVVQQVLAAGEIAAFTGTIGPELIDFFNSSPDIDVGTGDGFASMLLLMSNVTAPFDNVEFRNAVSMAIDVNVIVDTVYLGNATPGTAGYVRSGLDEYVPDMPHVFDTARANEILDSLGYTEKNNGGIRLNTDGSPLEVELLVGSTRTERIRTAEIISLQLGEVGISVVVIPMDPDTLDEFVWPDFDTAEEHNYQMAMWGWSAPVVQRPNAIAQIGSGDLSGLGSLNLSHYSNAEFDELAARLVESVDRSERAELNEQL